MIKRARLVANCGESRPHVPPILWAALFYSLILAGLVENFAP